MRPVVNDLARWFMTAPLPVVFAAGMMLAVPPALLVCWLLRPPAPVPPPSPYAHAQREYEQARDAYQQSQEAQSRGSTTAPASKPGMRANLS